MKILGKTLVVLFLFALFAAPFAALSQTCCCDLSVKGKTEEMPCHKEVKKQVASKKDKGQCSNCGCKMGCVSKIFTSLSKGGFVRAAGNFKHFTLIAFSSASGDYSIFTPPKSVA